MSQSEYEIRYRDSAFNLTLRTLTITDAEEIQDAVTESLPLLRPYMEWSHQKSTLESQQKRIATLPKTEHHFAVRQKGTFIMAASLQTAKSLNKNSFAIGYWTSLPHTNKGFATLITKILTIFAIDHLHSDRIEISCNKQNLSSKRVIEKCGFLPEGVLRNFFSAPTAEMIRNDYTRERTALLYALTPDDLHKFEWYGEVSKGMEVSGKGQPINSVG